MAEVKTRPKCRKAYQVVLDAGLRVIQIGFKSRLLGKRRADKVCKFLRKKGLDARVRFFGEIVLPASPRCFD